MQYTLNKEPLYEMGDITKEEFTRIREHFNNVQTIRGKNKTYWNDFITMDIETSTYGRSTDNPVAFTYSIAVYCAGRCYLFRTWRDYNWFIAHLEMYLSLNKYFRIVCYVHNLPYEFQFMRDFMHLEEVFATQPRKVVKCLSGSFIEYRCSYKLTNMGLARFTSSIPNLEHGKLSGDDFDYTKLRTPSTPLTSSELSYIYNDVAGLYEALDYTIAHDEYNLATIPNTSTGFVRDELRYAMKSNPRNRKLFLDTRLDQYTYGLLRTARRGGNTHCAPTKSCMVHADVTSMDMSSAYPAVMVQCKFPMTKFLPLRHSRLTDFEQYVETKACILDVTFKKISIKDMNGIPYIAKAHCTGFPSFKTIKNNEMHDEFLADNGRVLKATNLSMVLTDIDYKIIKEQYDFKPEDVICRECLVAEYGYLPDELRKLIIKQYRDKTTLKDKDPYMYMKQKNKFNANFGCMLTDICQDTVVYREHDCKPFDYENNGDYQTQLDKYYGNKNSFLSYQHGVWVTAHCRARLQKAINALGRDMIYCDTDSVKFFDKSVNRQLFDKLNADIRKEIKECGIECTLSYKGKEYTLGVWEPDGDYKYFKSMGAKKYCYVDAEDKFHITVAGLSKSKACAWLDEHGGIDAFHEDTLVPKEFSGRTTAKYNDYERVRILQIKETGETIEVGSNMVIEDTTYKFTLTEEYEDLLQNRLEGVIY